MPLVLAITWFSMSECPLSVSINDAALSPVYSADAASGYSAGVIRPGS